MHKSSFSDRVHITFRSNREAPVACSCCKQQQKKKYCTLGLIDILQHHGKLTGDYTSNNKPTMHRVIKALISVIEGADNLHPQIGFTISV